MQVRGPIITDWCDVQMFVCGHDVARCHLHAILEVHTMALVKIRDCSIQTTGINKVKDQVLRTATITIYHSLINKS